MAANLAARHLYFNAFVRDIRKRKEIHVKNVWFVLAAAALLAGCATATVETRRQEKYSAYSSLTPEMRELVDKGQIAVGMPMDAVYIAWGKPTHVISGQTERGTTTTWVYTGTGWQEYRFWNYRYYGGYRRGRYLYAYPTPYLDYDYAPYSYTAAEVFFENGVVKSWRNVTQAK